MGQRKRWGQRIRRCPLPTPLKTLEATFDESTKLGINGGTPVDPLVIDRSAIKVSTTNLRFDVDWDITFLSTGVLMMVLIKRCCGSSPHGKVSIQS